MKLISLLILVVAALGGCSTGNFSRYHSEQSIEQLETIVKEDFPLGTSKQAVISRIESIGLPLYNATAGLGGENTSTQQAEIRPPWWKTQGVYPTSSASLTFVFGGQQLASVHIFLAHWAAPGQPQWERDIGPPFAQ